MDQKSKAVPMLNELSTVVKINGEVEVQPSTLDEVE
jgi:hypothetical protein